VLLTKYYSDDHQGTLDGQGMWHVWGRREMHIGFRSGNLRVKGRLGDLGMVGRIILKFLR
jgi:hypothetical protein